MLVRIVSTLLLVGLVVFGYFRFRDYHEAQKERYYRKYAEAIAEVALAEQLYRHQPDSFLVVRDSILASHNLTRDSIDTFRRALTNQKTEWLKVWEIVKNLTDSLVDIHLKEVGFLEEANNVKGK